MGKVVKNICETIIIKFTANLTIMPEMSQTGDDSIFDDHAVPLTSNFEILRPCTVSSQLLVLHGALSPAHDTAATEIHTDRHTDKQRLQTEHRSR